MLWWNHGGWGAGDWLAMSFMMILFWGLLVLWLVRSNRRDLVRTDRPTGDPAQRADEVLAERFARGEIDENELPKRRQVLHLTRHRG
jgi:putative membrane protein